MCRHYVYCSELLGIEESWIRPSTCEGRWQGRMARLFQELGGIQMGRSSDLTAEEWISALAVYMICREWAGRVPLALAFM